METNLSNELTEREAAYYRKRYSLLFLCIIQRLGYFFIHHQSVREWNYITGERFNDVLRAHDLKMEMCKNPAFYKIQKDEQQWKEN